MLYLDVKLRFREVSGRFDLIAADGTDTGGGHYINLGLKWLDQHGDRPGTEVESNAVILAGTTNILVQSGVPGLSAVRNVFVIDPTVTPNTITELERIPITEMVKKRYTVTTVGLPLYYSLAVDSATYAVFDPSYTSVEIHPPPDTFYTFRMKGKEIILDMSNNGTTNYWTMNHPELLVWAACYCLEVAYRNSEGAKDWLNSIEQYFFDLQKEYIDGQLNESLILEG